MNEAALHELLSGRRRDAGAKLLRCGLEVASWGYSSVMSLRNQAYQHHWLQIHKAPVPVISLGNLTTGGTGKTPLAAWLANWLLAQGYRPGLLSRGYHALEPVAQNRPEDSPADSPVESKGMKPVSPGNDEKRVLDRLCPLVPHLQQRDRVAAARKIVAESNCNVLLLDDGFQHRRLHRDLDLVLIDALQPWGYGHVLPRGLLRESLSGLCRADLILITRANQCSERQRESLLQKLRHIRGTDAAIEVAFVPSQLVDLYGVSQPLSLAAGKKSFAFCGIGNPAGFRQTIASLPINSLQIQTFPDHYHYHQTDLEQLAKTAAHLGAQAVFTTQKDLVKIASTDWSGPPLYAIEIGVQFVRGASLLESRLHEVLAHRSSPRP